MIAKKTNASVKYYNNPRKEDAENKLSVSNKGFLELGLSPTKLEDGLIDEILEIAEKYMYNCDFDSILTKSLWTKSIVLDVDGKDN
jgi:UDP-sulfoquinovose synthase